MGIFPLKDVMQSSPLSNRRRTFSQLLRIYFTKKTSNTFSKKKKKKKNPADIQIQFPNPSTQPRNHPSHLSISHKPLHFLGLIHMAQVTQKLKLFSKIIKCNFLGITNTARFVHSIANSDNSIEFQHQPTIFVQNLLKFRRDKLVEIIEQALDLYASLR